MISPHTGSKHLTNPSAPTAAVIMLLAGCATPHVMRLTGQTPTRPGTTVWWIARDPANLRGPILAIEHRIDGHRSRQITLTRRGVRIFEYRAGRLIATGPPLPDTTAAADFEIVRATLRHFQRRIAASSAPDESGGSGKPYPRERIAAARNGQQTLPPLPDDCIDAIQCIEDAAELLQRCWAPAQVDPPRGLTFRRIDAQLEHFPHGVFELDEAAKAF